jgi:hypothetical protein
MYYNRAGADHDIVANRHWKNGGVGPDRNSVADAGRLPPFFVAGRTARRKPVVDKHDAMGDEAGTADRHTLANEAVGLDARIRTDRHVTLYFDKGADENMVANIAFIEVYGLYDGYIFPELNISDFYMKGVWFHRTAE